MSEVIASSVPVNDRYEEVADLSLLAVDQYLRDVRWITRLSDEDVIALLYQVYRDRCEQARERLVESYQPLVLYIARHRVHAFRNAELLDVVQDGNTGLLQAIDEWAPDLLTVSSCTGYMSTRIGQAMWKALYSTDRALAESVGVRQELSKLRHVVKELSSGLDREPTIQEIADVMGISPERVSLLCLWRDQAGVESVEEVQSRQVTVDRESFCSLYAVSSEHETPATLRRVVCAALELLTPRQREIIEARYGFGEGCTRMRTADEVAECLGVTQQTVLEMESWAMKHLAFFLAPLVASGRPSVRSAQEVPEYYTVKEVARLLGVTPACVAGRARRGQLVGVWYSEKWYFAKSAIDRLAASGDPSVCPAAAMAHYYTTEDVAGLFGVTPAWVAECARQGRLAGVSFSRKWYFVRSTIDALVGQQGNGATVDVA